MKSKQMFELNDTVKIKSQWSRDYVRFINQTGNIVFKGIKRSEQFTCHVKIGEETIIVFEKDLEIEVNY